MRRLVCLGILTWKLGPSSLQPGGWMAKLVTLARSEHVGRVCLVFRHGEKQQVDASACSDSDFWELSYQQPLTEQGLRQAEAFGKALRSRVLGQVSCIRLLSSEVPRCVETMEGVARAAGLPLSVLCQSEWMNATHRSGEEQEAAREMRRLGWKCIMDRLALGEDVSGFLPLPDAVHSLRRTWSSVEGIETPRRLELVLVCTHDVLLYALASRFGKREIKAPDFLDAALWWCEDGRDHLYYDSAEFTG